MATLILQFTVANICYLCLGLSLPLGRISHSDPCGSDKAAIGRARYHVHLRLGTSHQAGSVRLCHKFESLVSMVGREPSRESLHIPETEELRFLKLALPTFSEVSLL